MLGNDNDGPDVNETLTVTAVGAATNGTAVLDGGVVKYTPNGNFFGSDSFTYVVSDGHGTATATVNVTIENANDDPVANNDVATVAEDSTDNVIDVLGNDNDGPDVNETLTVTAVGAATNGTVVLDGGVVKYTPNGNFFGSDSFTYVVSDGNGTATATVNVTIEDVNEDPGTVSVIPLIVDHDPSQFSSAIFVGDQLVLGSPLTLTADDTNDFGIDLFAVAPTTGNLSLLTASVAGGVEGNSTLSWSPDGTAVIIQTNSTLTADDTNDFLNHDLFAVDLSNGNKTLLTASLPGGVEGHSFLMGLSPDGTTAIISSSSTLTADDTDGGQHDLFAVDLSDGSKTLLTAIAPAGAEGGFTSLHGWNPDGATVIIGSDSTLTPDDTDSGGSDLFLVDLSTGAKILLTASVPGGVDGSSSLLARSPDGTTAIIQSNSTLTANDTDGGIGTDLFVMDVNTGAKTLLTASVTGGLEGNSYLPFTGWSPDGATVIIESDSTLTADDADGGGIDLFAIDLTTGLKTLLTASVVGDSEVPSNQSFNWGPDGSMLIIQSNLTLTANDTDGGGFNSDLFAVNVATWTKTLLTASVGEGVEGNSQLLSWSPDGTTAIIGSGSTLTADDTDGGGRDLFAVDLASGVKTLLTGSVAGGVEGDYYFADWSPDGTIAIIASSSTLTADDTNDGGYDVFAFNKISGDMTLLTGTIPGGIEGELDFVWNTNSLKWSDDGQLIQVVTSSSLTQSDTDNGGYDIYDVNVTTGENILSDLGLPFVEGQFGSGEARSDVSGILLRMNSDYYWVI